MNLPFSYSKTPPAWLTDWPSDDVLEELFPEGIRRYAYRVIHQGGGTLKCRWTDERLIVEVGRQRVTWQWANGRWRRNCSCGYRHDRCAHAYAAARIFQEIANRENWLRKQGDVKPKKKEQASRRQPPRASADKPLHQLPLFGATVDHSHERAKKLEVEVDFHHAPGRASLRFYLFEDERRTLLRLQQLYNLGMQARHSSAARTVWSEEDRRFLGWCVDRLRRTSALRQNLQLLKLSRRQFDAWVNTWSDIPGRFIERDSQKILMHDAQAARMHIELTDEGEKVGIALRVTSTSGRRYLFHEIFERLASGQREAVLDGELLTLDPPFPWEFICEVFSRKTPRMDRRHVCAHLPALLHGRLDLVFGPVVERRESAGTVRLEARADGADILVLPTVSGAVVQLDTLTAASDIREEKDRFVITTYTSEELQDVRQLMRDLPFHADERGWLRLAGAPATIAAFAEAWEKLPPRVERQAAPDLDLLLSHPPRFVPVLDAEDRGAFVDIRVRWEGDGSRLSAHEMRDAVARKQSVVRTQSGHWLRLDGEAVAGMRAALDELGLQDIDCQRLFRPEARRLLQRAARDLCAQAGDASESFAERLVTEPEPETVSLPGQFQNVLRPYQVTGFDFLADRWAHNVGPILADDMGLGKTVQVLALLSACTSDPAHKTGGRTLVVCPASVVSVWLDEADKFCPNLRCSPYMGSPDERAEVLSGTDWDVLVANYAIVRQDIRGLRAHKFSYVVLDEAQYIKNPRAQVTRAVKSLQADRTLALTGTPVENRLLDLWSIMDFLNSGFLGSLADFQAMFDSDPLAGRRLAQRIAPVVLRRTKEVVAPELPPRTEETLKITLDNEQQKVYERERVRARKAAAEKGPLEVLAALTRLRQLCCDPRLLRDGVGNGAGSAKLDTLLEMLDEILGEGHSALVFSQFTSMLSLIEESLNDAGLSSLTITGAMSSVARRRAVEAFNGSDDPQVFLLSLKAAGTGLTLTKADYVFLYDPWWNPAVERQAIDRTHRIGQDKPVIAYRLVAAGTVEENVLTLQRQKAELFADVMQDAEAAGIPQRLTAEDLQYLLS
ncbi:MAG: DEAD/DEAH box helicase [Candidatus Pacebacteria bacterium]|nr:DEAD/DEAH box helicase [Candidatus Paceibacterota bacterium]